MPQKLGPNPSKADPLSTVYEYMGYKKSPILGLASSGALGGILGLLISSMTGGHKGKGMAAGALTGAAVGLPFTLMSAASKSKNIPVNKKQASFGIANEAVLSQNLWNFVSNKDDFDVQSRNVLSNTLRDAARIREIKTLTTNAKPFITTGDVVRAGVSAGLGALAAQTLGQVLGARNPRSYLGIGAGLGGAFELGNSLGIIR